MQSYNIQIDEAQRLRIIAALEILDKQDPVNGNDSLEAFGVAELRDMLLKLPAEEAESPLRIHGLVSSIALETRLIMTSRSFLCYAHGRDGDWEAICVDLDVAVQGASFEEVQMLLNEAVVEYVDAPMFETPKVRAQLLNRKAPWHGCTHGLCL